MDSIKEVYQKLHNKHGELVVYDTEKNTVGTSDGSVLGFEDYSDSGRVASIITFEGQRFQYPLSDYDDLCDFITEMLNGEPDIIRYNPADIELRRFGQKIRRVKTLRKMPLISRILSIIMAVVTTLLGAAINFSYVITSVDDLLSGAGKNIISYMAVLVLGISVTFLGISMFFHGISKHPMKFANALSYGAGVILCGFSATLTAETWCDKSLDAGKDDLFGMTTLFVIIAFFGILLIYVSFNPEKLKQNEYANRSFFLRRIPERLPVEQADRLMEKIMEIGQRRCIKLIFEPDREPELISSKLGGIPYWDDRRTYPTNINGRPLMLLAQINCAELPENSGFPRKGILQFFVHYSESAYDYDESAVIFHENVYTNITEQDVLEMGIPAKDSENMLPFDDQCALSFEESEMLPNADDEFSDKCVAEAANALGMKIDDGLTIRELMEMTSREDEIIEDAENYLLGYPNFVQCDTRDRRDGYDTLLFRLGSQNRKFRVNWGDCGAGQFFINGEKFSKGDFSDVFFTWDCC